MESRATPASACEQIATTGRSTFDPAYWLCRCEGFRVETPEGCLGYVEEVRLTYGAGRPSALVVYCNAPGLSRVLVPLGDVVELLPAEERVVLRAWPPAARTGPPPLEVEGAER